MDPLFLLVLVFSFVTPSRHPVLLLFVKDQLVLLLLGSDAFGLGELLPLGQRLRLGQRLLTRQHRL